MNDSETELFGDVDSLNSEEEEGALESTSDDESEGEEAATAHGSSPRDKDQPLQEEQTVEDDPMYTGKS